MTNYEVLEKAKVMHVLLNTGTYEPNRTFRTYEGGLKFLNKLRASKYNDVMKVEDTNNLLLFTKEEELILHFDVIIKNNTELTYDELMLDIFKKFDFTEENNKLLVVDEMTQDEMVDYIQRFDIDYYLI